jgi:hypothetical protein
MQMMDGSTRLLRSLEKNATRKRLRVYAACPWAGNFMSQFAIRLGQQRTPGQVELPRVLGGVAGQTQLTLNVQQYRHHASVR